MTTMNELIFAGYKATMTYVVEDWRIEREVEDLLAAIATSPKTLAQFDADRTPEAFMDLIVFGSVLKAENEYVEARYDADPEIFENDMLDGFDEREAEVAGEELFDAIMESAPAALAEFLGAAMQIAA